MTKSETVLKATGIEKAYKREKVLKGVDFELKRGRILALLGSNGAGKTTAVNILSGTLSFDKGSVNICGMDLHKDAKKIRNFISITGQSATIDEVQTGEENLNMMGRFFHVKDYKEKTKTLLGIFGLENAKNKRVSTYSGGMKRRLDIAMSLVGEPLLIFLDEPTTGLDPQSRNAVWQIIRELSDSGISIFLTTQHLEEAEQLADEIVILHEGKVIAQGDSESLKKTLPEGVILTHFYCENDLQKAKNLLNKFEVEVDEVQLKLSFNTEETAVDLQKVMLILSENDIKIQSFTQKKPSLEDVFLAIIGEEKLCIN